MLISEGGVVVVELVDIGRASADVKERVSAAEKLGTVLVESEPSVVETVSPSGMGCNSSNLSGDIFGLAVKAVLTSLDSPLLWGHNALTTFIIWFFKEALMADNSAPSPFWP